MLWAFFAPGTVQGAVGTKWNKTCCEPSEQDGSSFQFTDSITATVTKESCPALQAGKTSAAPRSKSSQGQVQSPGTPDPAASQFKNIRSSSPNNCCRPKWMNGISPKIPSHVCTSVAACYIVFLIIGKCGCCFLRDMNKSPSHPSPHPALLCILNLWLHLYKFPTVFTRLKLHQKLDFFFFNVCPWRVQLKNNTVNLDNYQWDLKLQGICETMLLWKKCRTIDSWTNQITYYYLQA